MIIFHQSGPAHWHEKYPDCAGVMQSPVAIESKKATFDISLLQFGFKGFSELVQANMTMKNNGHTGEIFKYDCHIPI